MAVQGLDQNGTPVNIYNRFPTTVNGTFQIFTTAQNIGHATICFGDPWDDGDMTEVTLTRFVNFAGNTSPNGGFWVGTVTSTFNQ